MIRVLYPFVLGHEIQETEHNVFAKRNETKDARWIRQVSQLNSVKREPVFVVEQKYVPDM